MQTGLMHALSARSSSLMLAAALACAVRASAAGGPENAIVVVNADSWASTYIANEYIAARRIPPANVVRLGNLPGFDGMKVEDFRTQILAPVLHAAEKRGIAPQIDYVLYSADFPWAIDVRDDVAGKQMPRVITQTASINGLTYLYPFTMSKNPGYLGLNVNFYYRRPALVKPEPEWSEDDRKLYAAALEALRRKGENANAQEKPAPGVPPPPALSNSEPAPAPHSDLQPHLESLLKLRTSHPANTELLYNLACMHARMGDAIAAVAALREAVNNGWWDMQTAAQDPDLASIRGREDFAILAARAKLVKFDLIPTSGFRANVGWLPTGQPVPMAKGMRYMLSTVLACTSGRGNSVSDALHSLQRSIAADGSRPKGTVYYMQNRDVRSTTREWGFRRATEMLRDAGVGADIEDGVLPKNKGDVAGVTIGAAGWSWDTCGSTLLPGAIGDNLTSYGGAMGEADGQTPISDFIRFGAAGAGGTVTEPYAIQAKFPTPFIHSFYAQGCSLAEAFYQSLAGPYQLLILGDGLCTPWKRDLTVLPGDLAPGSVVSGMLKITPTTRSSDGITAGAFELCLDGRRVALAPPGKPLELNTADVSDGPHELIVAAMGSDPIATRGSTRIPVIIRNGEHAEARVTAAATTLAWDTPLEITANAPGAKHVLLFHNADEVARIEGGAGSVRIDPRILGQGPSRLQPVVVLSETRQILTEPIAVRVNPPPALAAPSSLARQVYADGFTVKTAAGKKTVVQKADGNWLAGAGVAAGEKFTVEGWFRVPSAEVYQFQLKGGAALRLSVDGKPQDWPHGTGWWFVPVHLAAGRHLVKIEGVATAAPLDIRFGGPGSRKLEGTRFQHPNEG